ncbi:MAG: O-antigen ligase family protein [Spirochaetes bacterium]|nr:O-antigen ligase family protein [Spirochaetota bacterium]
MKRLFINFHRLTDRNIQLLFIVNSILFLYLARYISSAAPVLIFFSLAICFFLMKKHSNNELLKLLLLVSIVYIIWIIISFSMHYVSLGQLDPASYIDTYKAYPTNAIENNKLLSIMYVLFPIGFIAAISLFVAYEKFDIALVIIPILFIPSLCFAVIQILFDTYIIANPTSISGLSRDQSSFGLLLYLLFPLLLLGIIIMKKKTLKIFYIMMTVLLLLILMFRGQRTSFIGIIMFVSMSGIIMAWTMNVSKRKLLIIIGTSFSVIILLVILFISMSIYCTKRDIIPNTLMNQIYHHYHDYKVGGLELFIAKANRDRFDYAKQSIKVIRAYPFAGSGAGMFCSTVRDIRYKNKEPEMLLDNAANQYLQVASELGLFAMVLNLFMHILPLFIFTRISTRIDNVRDRLIGGICFSTMLIWMFLYFTGPHIISPDVMWIVTTYLACLLSLSIKYGYSISKKSTKITYVILLFCTILFIIGVQNATFGSNGYKAKLASYWWPYSNKNEQGIYPPENWNGRSWRWVTKKGYLTSLVIDDYINIAIMAPEYSIDHKKGLNVSIYIDNSLIDTLHFDKPEIQDRTYCVKKYKDKNIIIGIEVSKTFIPKNIGFDNDFRVLGVALGEVHYSKNKIN